MRTVYVDVLVAVNLLTDCMLLMSVGRLLRLQTKPWRIILGGAVGGCKDRKEEGIQGKDRENKRLICNVL